MRIVTCRHWPKFCEWEHFSIAKLSCVSEKSIRHLVCKSSFQTPGWCCFNHGNNTCADALVDNDRKIYSSNHARAIRQKKRIDTERFSIDRTRRKKSVFTGFEGKATVAVLVVIFVFLILWIPFLITRGFMALTQIYVSPIVTTSVVWLLHLNSVVNVFIYTVRRSDYRRAFVSIIRCTSLSRSADIERTVTNIHEASSKEVNLDRSSGTIQLNCTVTTIPEVTWIN